MKGNSKPLKLDNFIPLTELKKSDISYDTACAFEFWRLEVESLIIRSGEMKVDLLKKYWQAINRAGWGDLRDEAKLTINWDKACLLTLFLLSSHGS